ncbi:hypothetical protein Tco_0801059 [Tanacetum coccineum]|uniref:Uncharacterized protein n=1 Tax=Tanacetum coccineum TaxID=301880 RepID=A0ABQ4ZX83_9ASTR
MASLDNVLDNQIFETLSNDSHASSVEMYLNDEEDDGDSIVIPQTLREEVRTRIDSTRMSELVCCNNDGDEIRIGLGVVLLVGLVVNEIRCLALDFSDVLCGVYVQYDNIFQDFSYHSYSLSFENLITLPQQKEKGPTLIYENNSACVAQMNEGYIKSDRTKHIPPRYFAYTQDLIKDNQIEMKYVQSSNNSTDLFTKALPTSVFKKHVHAIGMRHVHKT